MGTTRRRHRDGELVPGRPALVRSEAAEEPRVGVETLVLWGERDRFLGKEMAARVALCDRGRLEFFEAATHWLQHDEPAAVNDRLVRFLGSGLDALAG